MVHLPAAFSPESFREQGHRVVDQLADLLASVSAGEGRVLPWEAPSREWAFWEARMEQPLEEVADFLAEFAAHSIKIHHPQYIGHQVCGPAPSAALAGFVAEF